MVLYTLDEASEAYVIGGLSYTDDQMNSKDSKILRFAANPKITIDEYSKEQNISRPQCIYLLIL
jgi:hypothetical protein